MVFPPFPTPVPTPQIHWCLTLWDLQWQPPQQSIYPTPEPFYTGAPSGALTFYLRLQPHSHIQGTDGADQRCISSACNQLLQVEGEGWLRHLTDFKITHCLCFPASWSSVLEH